jgi:hypothetical protein
MAKTIGNPLTWTVQNARHTGEHFSASLGTVGSEGNRAMPEIRKL